MRQKALAYGRAWTHWLLEPLQLLVIAQTVFLSIGIPYLDFHVGWLDVATAVITAVAVEYLASYIRSRRKNTAFRAFFPSSALAAALGIGIFFRASSPLFFCFAALAAILSKYVLTIGGRHICNPSNFGIVLLVLLAPFAATIEFSQWGNNSYVYAAVLVISLAIAYRAGAIVTTLSFIISYAIALVALLPLSPDLFVLHHYGLIGPSFILFASFMITDPRTSPTGFYPRIIHGVSITLLYFGLEVFGVRYALFMTSFGVAILNAIVPFLTPTRFSPIISRLPNAATGLIALIVFLSACSALIAQQRALPDFFRPSLSFLLFGVEGANLVSCKDDPLFRTTTRSGLETSPSSMAAAWGDYDNDGFDDIFVSGYAEPSTLYRNNGDATFTDVTEEVGLPHRPSGPAVFVDYDNDGQLDLFLVTYLTGDSAVPASPAAPFSKRTLRLFKNHGGQFRDATESAGLSAFQSPLDSAAASFADFDQNGTLDLVVSDHGLHFDLFKGINTAQKKSSLDPFIKRTNPVLCGADVRDVLSAHPDLRARVESIMSVQEFLDRRGCLIVIRSIEMKSGGSAAPVSSVAPVIDALLHIPGTAHLYLNTGKRFERRAGFTDMIDALSGGRGQISSDGTKMLEGFHPYDWVSGAFFQPVSFDYNGDGRTDIFITSDFGSNLLLKNVGGLKFQDATKEAGLNFFGSGMGVAIGDYDNDAIADIFVSNSLADSVFRNNGNGTFSSMTDQVRLGTTGVGWGIAFLDYDLDGHEDVYIANGDHSRSSTGFDSEIQRPLLRKDNLYKNLGNGFFEDRTGVDMCSDTETGFAAAVSDYDNDGDPDVFVGNAAIFGGVPQSNVFMENTLPHSDKNFISIRLAGVVDNSRGIGSKVSVTSLGTTRTKFLTLGGGFRSQNSSTLLFGLGTNDAPVDIRVLWPSGQVTERKGVDVNRIVTISQ